MDANKSYVQTPQMAQSLSKSRFVSADARVSRASRFGNYLWQMESLVTLPGTAPNRFHWDFREVPGFPGGFALTLAEHAYARLYKPAETHDRNGSWLTVRLELYNLNRFAKFCWKDGYTHFSKIDDNILHGFKNHLELNGVSTSQIREIFRNIYRLWEYNSRHTDGICQIPFGKRFEKFFGRDPRKDHDENKTPRIPEQLFRPLVGCALDYVLTYSAAILSTWSTCKEITKTKMSNQRRKKEVANLLATNSSTWRNLQWTCISDLQQELQQLRVACTIVILAFSGVRSSELLSVEINPIIVDVDEQGNTFHYLNTILHKHTGGGRRDTWIVIEEVASAINILESLTKHIRDATGETRLFITDGSSLFFSPTRNFEDKRINELSCAALTLQIRKFVSYSNKKLVCEKIPDWLDKNGVLRPWTFNTRQFRRTLAYHIAREPFGIIAGMLQYKHVSSAVFEGYAGSEPEWNKMLESEQVLSGVDILEEIAIDLSHGEISGKYGQALKAQFEAEFRGRAEDYPASQISKWLSNQHKSLHVAKFNLCFFDPTQALCIDDPNEKDTPVLNSCDPNRCQNSCVTKNHLPLWKAQLKQVENMLDSPKISNFQRNILATESTELTRVIKQLGEDNG